VSSTGSQELSAAEDKGASRPETGKLLFRNTLYLTLSQALTIPLSVLVNIVAARYLGPEAFGLAYLAYTICSFGFLVVSWGHDGMLPAVVARDHAQSGSMLGSSLAFRAAVSLPVYAVMAIGCYLFGYGAGFQWVLGLVALHLLLTAFVAGCKDTIRGLERTDIPAYAHVGQQLLSAAFVVPVLMLGGQLRSFVGAQIVACAVTLVAIGLALKATGVGRLSFSWDSVKTLALGGTPFVVSGLVINLQPMLDALFLSKLSSSEVIGWYAVARRLVGVLIFPATALIGALYPTLCRLYVTDRKSFIETTSASLRNVSLVVVPVTLACALYADFAVALFNKQAYGPTADDLRVLSLFIGLVYFTMPLGSAILAAGRRRAWSIVQSICVVVCIGLDWYVVPFFQQRYGNGGIGLCLTSVLSEVAVVVCGVVLAPKGIFDRGFARSLFLAAVAGGAMAVVAYLLRSITPFVAAPIAVLAYAGGLWVLGGVDPDLLAAARGFFSRKFAKKR